MTTTSVQQIPGAQTSLGDEVQDTVTGIKGIVVGQSLHLNGCIRVGVQPKADGKDASKYPEQVWLDDMQLKIIKKAKPKKVDRTKGGPIPSVPRREASPR